MKLFGRKGKSIRIEVILAIVILLLVLCMGFGYCLRFTYRENLRWAANLAATNHLQNNRNTPPPLTRDQILVFRQNLHSKINNAIKKQNQARKFQQNLHSKIDNAIKKQNQNIYYTAREFQQNIHSKIDNAIKKQNQ